MKYATLVRKHLERTGERVDDFASRAGVCRATVFNLLAEEKKVGLGSIKAMLEAAGYSLEPVPSPVLMENFFKVASNPTQPIAPTGEISLMEAHE